MESLNLFGTSGIRGPADKLFTEQFCYDIGKAFCLFLRRLKYDGPIAVGMDPRKSSPRIKKDLLKGFAKDKRLIYDQGITPIPSINWLIKNTPVKAGIMITGSHISAELNGLKFFAHDEEITKEDENIINKIYSKIKDKEHPGVLEAQVIAESRAKELYMNMLAGLAQKHFPKWKIALDCANGAQSVVMPSFLKSLGFEVIILNSSPQNEFIARDTDTDDQAKIESLKKTVVEMGCDFGIAFDSDGDRAVFVDENGNFIHGEYSCCLVAKNLVDDDKIVTTISASQVVDHIGKKVFRTKVGSPFIISKMKEVGAKFGFEPNGGAVSAEIMYTRDGGSLTVKIMNIFSNFDGSFSELIATLPKFYMARTKIEYDWILKDKIIKAVRERFYGHKIEDLDGLKIWLDKDSWVLFRSSSNAPEFRVFAESDSSQKSQNLLKQGVEIVKSVIEKEK